MVDSTKVINLANNSYKITLSTGKYRGEIFTTILKFQDYFTTSHQVFKCFLDDMSEGEYRLLSESERSNFLF